VLPHLPDTHLVLLPSIDVYRAYELILAARGGEPVPLSEESPVRAGRYPLRGLLPGLGEHYDKLDVEPGYLARGGTALRLAIIYGEHDGQRREEFILRRVRAGRRRIPVGAGSSLDTRGYVGDVASAVLAALDQPAAATGEVFNVGDLRTDTVRDYARRILTAAGSEAELITVPEDVVPEDMEATKSMAQHSWSTAARRWTGSAGAPPTRRRPSRSRCAGTWPTLRTTPTRTSPPTTAPWPPQAELGLLSLV
jgi:hypothetical protein